jgi:hypothetical protein
LQSQYTTGKENPMANTYQGIKSNSIYSSPFAEQTLTLSQIDSMYQNGEIDADTAKEMAVEMALETKGTNLILEAVLSK